MPEGPLMGSARYARFRSRMSVSAVMRPRIDTFDAGPTWAERHRLLGRLVMAALSARLQLSSEPTYANLAQLGALAGLIGGGRMRQVVNAAVRALGSNPTRQATRQFAWSWWYQRSASSVLTYQADRLTPAWAERHVAAPESLPSGGCILVSVHQFNQRLAFARLNTLVEELGCVSMFEPLAESDLRLSPTGFGVDARPEVRAVSRFCHQVFGRRIFPPRTAARRGLELLRRGGSLIVLSDFFGREPVCVLGKRLFVPRGALWWAAQSGRPIVPFGIAPVSGDRQHWQLWCGEPIPATLMALGGALEDCIRRSPTAWTGWPAWYAAPDFAA
jgi:hypothetical protein